MTSDLGKYWEVALRYVEQDRPGADRSGRAEWLTALRPDSIQLRRNYLTEQPQIPYGASNVRHPYLLRYFVPYAQIFRKVLESIPIQQVATLQATEHLWLFGGGPAPELAAFVDWQKDKSIDQNLQCFVFDQHAEEWDSWHQFLSAQIAAERRDCALIGWPHVAGKDQMPYRIHPRSLIVAQNFVNELPPAIATQWLRSSIDTIERAPDSTLLLVHPLKYEQCQSTHQEGMELAHQKGLGCESGVLGGSLPQNVPSELSEFFHRFDNCYPLRHLENHTFGWTLVAGPSTAEFTEGLRVKTASTPARSAALAPNPQATEIQFFDPTCATCGGKKLTGCPGCIDAICSTGCDGTSPCEDCSGDGEFECENCDDGMDTTSESYLRNEDPEDGDELINDWDGLGTPSPCEDCGGAGRFICADCAGEGKVECPECRPCALPECTEENPKPCLEC